MDLSSSLFGSQGCYQSNSVLEVLDKLAGYELCKLDMQVEFLDEFEDVWEASEDFSFWKPEKTFEPAFESSLESTLESTLESSCQIEPIHCLPFNYNQTFRSTQQNFRSTQETKSSQVNYEAVYEWGEESGDPSLWGECNTLWSYQEYSRTPCSYNFSEVNPYLSIPSPLHLANDFIAECDTPQAILALEAALQRNTEDSEVWSMLARLNLFQANYDQAFAAMKDGLDRDPYNLQLLFNYILHSDVSVAKAKCKAWLQNHPDYSLLSDSYDIYQCLLLATQVNPRDPSVYIALGFLDSIENKLTLAEQSFKKALVLDPENSICWNKLGEVLMNQSKFEAALGCFDKALCIVPDYLKAWVNMGHCFKLQKKLTEASRFYLCALALNKSAENTLIYLYSTFSSMGRPDLVQKLKFNDPFIYKDEFWVVSRKELKKANNYD